MKYLLHSSVTKIFLWTLRGLAFVKKYSNKSIIAARKLQDYFIPYSRKGQETARNSKTRRENDRRFKGQKKFILNKLYNDLNVLHYNLYVSKVKIDDLR